MKNIFFIVSIFNLFGCQTSPNKIENIVNYGEPGVACLSERQTYNWKNRTKPSQRSLLTNPLTAIKSLMINIPTAVTTQYGQLVPDMVQVLGLAPNEMPVCGNWCGAGYPNRGMYPNLNPPALDPLDAACKRHDLCYEKRGMYDCSCDEEFANEVSKDRLTGDISLAGLKAALYFRISSCKNGCKSIMGFTRCDSQLGDWTK